MNILLVDDDAVFLKTLERLLAECGYHVRTAANGLEALRRIEEKLPDLILSDIQMPAVDGIELLRRVQERFPGTPVVLMTAFRDADSTAAAFAYGAQGYLQKPFRVEALLVGIRRFGTIGG